jgi:hypothetical protein
MRDLISIAKLNSPRSIRKQFCVNGGRPSINERFPSVNGDCYLIDIRKRFCIFLLLAFLVLLSGLLVDFRIFYFQQFNKIYNTAQVF